MSSVVYQFDQNKTDKQTKLRVQKAIAKKHRFSNDTLALEKYYFQCNEVYNFLPFDPADMI